MTQSALDALNTSPQLVFELAAGVESLEEIAERYELDITFLRELMETKHVKRMVKEKRKELDETGFTLAQKAKLCFEDLLGAVYQKAKKPDAGLGQTLAAAEFFRKVAGLDKMDVGAQQDKFSITINLGGAVPTASPAFTINAEPTKPEFKMPALFLTVPEYITPTMADANLTDLAYNEAGV